MYFEDLKKGDVIVAMETNHSIHITKGKEYIIEQTIIDGVSAKMDKGVPFFWMIDDPKWNLLHYFKYETPDGKLLTIVTREPVGGYINFSELRTGDILIAEKTEKTYVRTTKGKEYPIKEAKIILWKCVGVEIVDDDGEVGYWGMDLGEYRIDRWFKYKSPGVRFDLTIK